MAQQDEYRQGFIEGYKQVRGRHIAVPSVPAMNAIRAGETAYEQGIRRGTEAAQK